MLSRKAWKTAAAALVGIAAVWLTGKYLLGVLLPFLLGLLAALAVERPVRFLQDKMRLPRTPASVACVLMLYAALSLAVGALLRTLYRELTGFLRQLPELSRQVEPTIGQLEQRLLETVQKLPDGLGRGLHESLESFFENGAALGSRAYDRLFRLASGFLTAIPDVLLFSITTLLAGFLFSCELPKLRALYAARLPQPWQEKLGGAGRHLKSTLGKWLRAQLKLMLVTFFILTMGMMLLNVSYPLLFGLLTTLVDALPVLGTGTVLLPWSLAEFLKGQTRSGVGFLILYAAAALTRQSLEPRLVGKSMGLSPLITLAALYVGYRAIGVLGMIVFPISVMLLKQLFDHAA